jgi:hypothetical protein
MASTFSAYFDGQVFRPESPLELVPNRRYLVTVAGPAESSNSPEVAHPLSAILAVATDMGVTDLADRHKEYARLDAERNRHGK